MTGEALAVHDGVDAHGVGIGAGGCAHHNDLPADMLADIVVGVLHAHDIGLHGDDVDVLIVHGVDAAAVDHIEGELLVQGGVIGHVGLFQAHLLGDLAGSFFAPLIVLDGQFMVSP